MNVIRNLAVLGHAVGQETRAKILARLLLEGEKTLGSLEKLEGVTMPAIREHIKVLEEAGLVALRKEERWSIASIVDQSTATLIRKLFNLANEGTELTSAALQSKNQIPECSKSYDFLTGEMGLRVFSYLQKRGIFVGGSPRRGLSDEGRAFAVSFGIDVDTLESARRPVGQFYRDRGTNYTYYGGGLGKALLQRMMELGWFREVDDENKLAFNETYRTDFDATFPEPEVDANILAQADA